MDALQDGGIVFQVGRPGGELVERQQKCEKVDVLIVAQLTGRNRNQQLCKIDSGAVDQARMDIIRRRRSADRATYLPIAPPEIADAPPHQEIEVLLAFCIVNVIAAGSGELQITRRFVPGQIFPVPFTNGHTETIYRPLALLEFSGY